MLKCGKMVDTISKMVQDRHIVTKKE